MKYLFITTLLALSLTACSGHHDHNSEHGHSDADVHSHNHRADEIILQPQDAARFGIEIDTVSAGTFTETLKVSGEILSSSSDKAVVSAPTAGIVRLAPDINVGTIVRTGQTVATISSGSVTGGDANTSAKVALENAKRELDRITPLLADGLVTKKDYNEALAAYKSAKAAYSPKAASGVASAPRSGVVTSINVGDGEYVEVGQPIASIVSNNNMTLRALVPVSQADFLKSINGAVMSFHNGNTVDIADYNGQLLSSSQAGAGETPGYIPVFFSFNSSAPVIPGSATEVYLKGRDRGNVISIPKDAIVEQMGETFVFIRKGDHVYVKKPVETGGSDGRRVEITNGLNQGETVVVKGATFVRLAEQATVAPEGHSHNH